MPLKKELDKADWEKLPDYLQGDYEEKDGKMVKKTEPADPNTEKEAARLKLLRETADRNASKAQELQKIVDALPKDEEGNPLDPDKLIEMLEEARSAKETVEKVPSKVKSETERAVNDARKKWDKEKAALERERDEERQANHDLLVANTIKTWVGTNIHPDYQEEVEDSLLRRLNPEVRREVVDGKPTRKAVTKIDGFDEDLGTYLDEKWKATDKAKKYLRAPDNSGGDQGDGSRPKPEGAPSTPSSRAAMTTKQKSDYIDQHGADAYNRLPA